MSPKRIFGFVLILLLSGGCQPAVKAKVTDEVVQPLRVITSKEGYYRISSQELQSQGFKAGSGEQVQLNFEGELYPYWLVEPSHGSEFNILFYSPPAGRYLTNQVFILEKTTSGIAGGKPSILPIQSEVQSGNHENVQFRKTLEPQLVYLSQAGIEDPWLWQNIDPRKSTQLTFSLDGKKLTGQFLGLKFWSPTNAPASPDHAIQIRLNGSNLGVFEWEGAGWKTVSIPLDMVSLGNENELIIEMTALDEVVVQKIYLDEVLIVGQMNFQPDGQPLTFFGSGSFLQTDKSSFDGYLIELDNTKKTFLSAKIKRDTGFGLKTIKDARYDWLPDNEFQEVDRIEKINWDSDLVTNEMTADWLVIAPSQYFEVIQPLITLRNNQGFQTKLVDAQQIYDQFYGGSPDPKALSIFFESVKSTWQNFPECVLLIGDFTYEHQNYDQVLEGIPSYFVKSAFAGETVSDLPMMDLDGDDLPDFVIGRIPVENSGQLKHWVEKLIEYELNVTKPGFNKIIAIADNQEANFGEAAGDFLSNFSDARKTFLYLPEKDQGSVPDEVRSFFDGESEFLAYFGHGSINTWGKDNLFSVEDMKRLGQNELVPFVVNFSCLTGYYIHPEITSMAEALLFQEGGGSIAVIAPTSLTFQTTQSVLSTVISNEIQFGKSQRLVDLIKPAWRSMDPENTASLEVMQTFLLFGDPAMTIHP